AVLPDTVPKRRRLRESIALPVVRSNFTAGRDSVIGGHDASPSRLGWHLESGNAIVNDCTFRQLVPSARVSAYWALVSARSPQASPNADQARPEHFARR